MPSLSKVMPPPGLIPAPYRTGISPARKDRPGRRQATDGVFGWRVTAGLVTFLLALLTATPALSQETFTEARYFQGLVRRDMAERVAQAAAEQLAFKNAIRLLAKHPDLGFAPDAGAPQEGLAAAPPLEGLAAKLYSTEVIVLGMQGFPPNMQAFVEVRLVPPKDLRTALHAALLQPSSLELYTLLLSRRAQIIAEYDTLAAKVLPLNPHNGGGKEDFYALQGLVHNLDALNILQEALKLHELNWTEPEKAYELIRKAQSMAQTDPLLRTALAEVLLQLDRPSEAMEQASLAASASPGFARAHDIKGAIFLRQLLPALAAESFGQAVTLDPGNAAYYVHRASAYLIQEETQAMCADFQSACALGDCEGYQWARRSGKCLPPTGQAGTTEQAGAAVPDDAGGEGNVKKPTQAQ